SEKEYVVWQKREFFAQRERVFNGYRQSLQNFATKMAGMRYEMRDAFDVVLAAKEDPNALIWFNPPGYSQGYSRMFDPRGHYVWNQPSIPELDPAKTGEFIAELAHAPATVLVYGTEDHALD